MELDITDVKKLKGNYKKLNKFAGFCKHQWEMLFKMDGY